LLQKLQVCLLNLFLLRFIKILKRIQFLVIVKLRKVKQQIYQSQKITILKLEVSVCLLTVLMSSVCDEESTYWTLGCVCWCIGSHFLLALSWREMIISLRFFINEKGKATNVPKPKDHNTKTLIIGSSILNESWCRYKYFNQHYWKNPLNSVSPLLSSQTSS
jgi:hypothetical protein